MPTTPDLSAILIFLDGLRRNNHKDWFEQHRSDYESARSTFYEFVDDLIDELRLTNNLQGLAARDCVPRIYRDVRFSKDKSPYKTNFGAMISPGGWKTTVPGNYVSLEPHAHSMVAGGLYHPAPEQLERFRRAIDADAAAFKEIINAPDFVATFGELTGERLKTAPKGYDRDHPELALLQFKQITVLRRFADSEVLAPDFKQRVVSACRVVEPFLDYLAAILR